MAEPLSLINEWAAHFACDELLGANRPSDSRALDAETIRLHLEARRLGVTHDEGLLRMYEAARRTMGGAAWEVNQAARRVGTVTLAQAKADLARAAKAGMTVREHLARWRGK